MQASRRQFVALLSSAVVTGAVARIITSPSQRVSTESLNGFTPPQFQETPFELKPIGGLSDLVPRERVVDLLNKLAPCWNAIKVSLVIHALRLWGTAASFPIDRFRRTVTGRLFTGQELLDFFLNHDFYSEVAIGGPPLFVPSDIGLKADYDPPIANDFTGRLAHRDDFLQVCCDLGLPLVTPIINSTGVYTLRDVLLNSVAYFRCAGETEWSAEVFARYLAPRAKWTNAFGESIDFDTLSQSLLAKKPGQGACLGTHVEYSLAALLQVNHAHSMLSALTVSRIRDRLQQTADLLSSSAISSSGGWNGNWSGRETSISNDPLSQLTTRVMSTGHHLEWLAIAPPEVRPPDSIIADAALGALDDAAQLTAFQREGGYVQLSHLAKALCLMKNVTADEMISMPTGSR